MRFYKPMLAKSVSKPFSGKDWIFEIKWDGFRAIAYVDDFFTIQSRNLRKPAGLIFGSVLAITRRV